MKTKLMTLCSVAAVVILSGCGESKSPGTGGSETQPAVTPAAEAAPAVAASPEPTKPVMSAPEAVAPAVDSAKSAVADLTSQFSEIAAKQSDTVLSSIGSDLAGKAKSLGQSLVANDAIKSQLSDTLQSLSAGKDSAALNSVYQVVQSATKLTPQQMGLAKEVGNLASAFVVQRNFASLDGAQGDVATIVNSLRKGELAATIPPIQNIAQNANLTATQKELISTLADKYAPGLKKATDALQQSVQSLKNLPGLK